MWWKERVLNKERVLESGIDSKKWNYSKNYSSVKHLNYVIFKAFTTKTLIFRMKSHLEYFLWLQPCFSSNWLTNQAMLTILPTKKAWLDMTYIHDNIHALILHLCCFYVIPKIHPPRNHITLYFCHKSLYHSHPGYLTNQIMTADML